MNNELNLTYNVSLGLSDTKKKEIYLGFKRYMDILISLIAIILLSPIFLINMLIIKLTSDGPCIYKHARIGKNGRKIYVYKFRTMVSDANNLDKYFTEEQKKEFLVNYKLDNDPRITKIGKILRRTSLDELPQLINIIKGDMALIGPRPVVEKEIDYFGNEKDTVLSVLPGLTGWWACNGRSCTTYEKRVELESYYAKNVSLKLDLICFIKTIGAVLEGHGAK